MSEQTVDPGAPESPETPEGPKRRGRLLVLAAIALVVVLVAVGALVLALRGGDPPSDAAKDDYCANQEKLLTGFNEAAVSGDDGAVVTAVKDWAEAAAKTGTPSSMPADARAGFLVQLREIEALPDDASVAQVAAIQTDLSQAESDQLQQTELYTTNTCGQPDLSELMGGMDHDMGGMDMGDMGDMGDMDHDSQS